MWINSALPTRNATILTISLFREYPHMDKKKQRYINIKGQWYTIGQFARLERKSLDIVKEFRKHINSSPSGSKGRSVPPMGDGYLS